MRTFELADLTANPTRPWFEFLRATSLSMGIYRLNVGDEDKQRPHTEDEVYYVIKGRSSFEAEGERRWVTPGTLLFVERKAPHRFYDITEDLTLLVFFAPPEGAQAELPRPLARS